MEYGLANPIQYEENDVWIDVRPKTFYWGYISSQTIKFPGGTLLPIDHDNVLSYLPVWRPTSEEINECDPLGVTSRFHWDLYTKEGLFS